LSPDGTTVVYVADQETDDEPALYSVPATGGEATRLTGAMVAGVLILEIVISADNQWVVYRADQQTAGTQELYSVPVGGGEVAKLNVPVSGSYFVFPQRISPDSARVVYATGNANGQRDLYSVPIAGGDSTLLNPTALDCCFNLSFSLAPGGERVVYADDREETNVVELWSVPLAGGAVSKLNGPLVEGGGLYGYRLSEDGSWVVYTADQELDGFPTGHRVPVAGPAGDEERIWYRAAAAGYEIDLARSRVVVLGNEALVDGVVRLWSFPLLGDPDPGGGEELVPRAAFVAGGDADAFRLAADGTILYRADQLQNDKLELFAVPLTVFWDDFESGETDAWSAEGP
jgi:hypothetical protein